jgi:RNA polymerase sigma-70 factor (ECF subfamily)
MAMSSPLKSGNESPDVGSEPSPTPFSSSSLEDSALIERAKNSDEEAFKILFHKYQRALRFHITRMVKDKEEIDDLVQDIFLKAFTHLVSYNTSYAFSTWLYRIATNHTIDYLRKKKLNTFSIHEPISTKDGEMSIELPDHNSQADALILNTQRDKIIHEALDLLPEKYRMVIEMRHMEEKSYQEISEALDLPLGTVKAHIFRARELLYKYLKDRRSAF